MTALWANVPLANGTLKTPVREMTPPLPAGTYPVKVTVVDAAGNESTAAEDIATLDTYARSASSLTVDSYDVGTDALTLSWTATEDFQDG